MSLQGLYFIDIEAVPGRNPDQELLDLFDKRHGYKREHALATVSEQYEAEAGLHAEFGQVVCVSLGIMINTTFFVKAFKSTKEASLLREIRNFFEDKKVKRICGHNLKEYDGPVLFRRMIINGVLPPDVLNTPGKKPWDVAQDDTMEMWGATQFKYKVSLELLCKVLGIPSPKGELFGGNVYEQYKKVYELPDGVLPFDWEDQVLKPIGDYCNRDVVSAARVYCKLKGIPVITDDQIEYR